MASIPPPPPRPFSPGQQQISPPISALSPSTESDAFRAHKRQRLSPKPGSPSGLSPGPAFDHPSPSYFFNNDNYTTPPADITNGGPVMASMPSGGGLLNTSGSGVNAMGPPSRPVEKKETAAALTDVLIQAGVNTADEEGALLADLTTNRIPKSSSFNSATSGNSASGWPIGSSQTTLPISQTGEGIFPDGSGPAQQSASSHDFVNESWQEAIRAHASSKQLHLSNPFLNINVLLNQAWTRAYHSEVKIPNDGVQNPGNRAPRERTSTHTRTGADGSSITAFSVAGGVLRRDAPMSEILALLSLATEQRIRTLIEDAAAVAATRQAHAHGLVPIEWHDLSVSDPRTKSSSSKQATASNGTANTATSNPLKRSQSTAEMIYPNQLSKAIRHISTTDRLAEEARLAKRARRALAASLNSPGPNSSGTPPPFSDPNYGGVSPPSLIAPMPKTPGIDPVTGRRQTKKELAKQASQKADVAQQQASANVTALSFLGGGGGLFGKKKGKGYSWMTGSSPAGLSTPLRGPAGGGSSVYDRGGRVGGPVGGPGEASSTGSTARAKRIGDFREDRESSGGIQMRDLLTVLEEDGKWGSIVSKLWSKVK